MFVPGNSYLILLFEIIASVILKLLSFFVTLIADTDKIL